MKLNLQNKKKIISDINFTTSQAISAIIIDFRNINANVINELRKICRESKIIVRVVKNTILKKAILNTQFECLKEMSTGPTMIAYSTEYINIICRIFKKFEKKYPNLKIKAGSFNNKLISYNQVDYFAKQPTYNEAILKLINIIKEFTIGRFLKTLLMISNIKKNNHT